MSAAKCPRRYCGEPLSFATDGAGRVVATCPACARNRAGLCRDCPAPLANRKQLRCARCAQARRTARHDNPTAWRARYEDPAERERRKVRARAYYRRNRERLLAQLKAQREGRERDALDRLYFRLKSRQYRANATPRQRRRAAAARKAYYERNRERILARQRAYRQTPEAKARGLEHNRRSRAKRRALLGYQPGHCVVCNAEIPYQGKGPRRQYCGAHRSERYRRYRQRRRDPNQQQTQECQERAA